MARRPEPTPRLEWIARVLYAGTALSALNSGMIAVALITLRHEFGLDVATVTWVITVYYLASAPLQPIMGRLADRHGPRRVFSTGMILVIAAGALGPFAPNFAWLCVIRVLLALGTAAAFPAAAAMLRQLAGSSTPKGTQRPGASKLIARVQTFDTSAGAAGPALGGILIALFGWEAIFWINIPLALIALVGTRRLVPPDAPRPHISIRTTLREMDLPGIMLVVIALAALVAFVLELTEDPLWWLLPVIPLAVVLFGWRELHCRTPFLDLRILAANTPLVRAYVFFILASTVFYSVLFGVPPYLEDHAGYRTEIIGFLLLPLAAFSVVLAPVVERLIDRHGLRPALLLGAGGLALAATTLLALAWTTAPIAVLLAAAAVGVTYVVVLVSVTQLLGTASPARDAGTTAGLFQTARTLGGICAVLVVGASFSGGTGSIEWTTLSVTVIAVAVSYLAVVALWRHARATDTHKVS